MSDDSDSLRRRATAPAPLVALALLGAVATGCGDDPTPARPDGSTVDVPRDTAVDVASDEGSDVSSDAPSDAVRDVARDTAPDAEPDAAPDAEPDAALDAARRGGKVVAPAREVMGGRMAVVQDPAGAVMGLWQPAPA